MKYWEAWRRRRAKKYRILYKRGPSNLALIFAGMAMAIWLIFVLLSSYPIAATLYYALVPSTTRQVGEGIVETAQASASQSPVVSSETIVPADPSLPQGHYLSVPKLGVETEVREAELGNYEAALRLGVWRVPDFGSPSASGRPMILAAHRFGYLAWSQEYREKNSFYNLPKLQVGDQIQVVWDQRRYNYVVTRVGEGTEIDDYSGDLILYTCKFLVSPIRYFVYARLVK